MAAVVAVVITIGTVTAVGDRVWSIRTYHGFRNRTISCEIHDTGDIYSWVNRVVLTSAETYLSFKFFIGSVDDDNACTAMMNDHHNLTLTYANMF